SLNRPDKANALNEKLWQEIPDFFKWADQEASIRVVVLKGEGKHFCAGIDLSVLAGLSQNLPQEIGRRSEALEKKILEFQDSFNAIEKCHKPVIAQIHGACLGGGLDLVAACDLRFASQEAEFAIKEIDMGMVADVGTLQRLPKLMNLAWLSELAYTGRTLKAPEAKEVGLLNECFASLEALEQKVEEVANQMAKKSPLALRHTKAMLLYARDHSVEENLKYIARLNSSLLLSEDVKKSVMAFLEKKTADYED
ncbi:MAG: crotonase/enoyl-CoA hydratase family protein, partial [Deltaproteobacteria bacterium]|nr:crotonase/enoyl-CoA hydratase family protein [Deltaproteobacteria bacterium]